MVVDYRYIQHGANMTESQSRALNEFLARSKIINVRISQAIRHGDIELARKQLERAAQPLTGLSEEARRTLERLG